MEIFPILTGAIPYGVSKYGKGQEHFGIIRRNGLAAATGEHSKS
jgi:hypothetical protein